jgi:hypothetical protein
MEAPFCEGAGGVAAARFPCVGRGRCVSGSIPRRHPYHGRRRGNRRARRRARSGRAGYCRARMRGMAMKIHASSVQGTPGGLSRDLSSVGMAIPLRWCGNAFREHRPASLHVRLPSRRISPPFKGTIGWGWCCSRCAAGLFDLARQPTRIRASSARILASGSPSLACPREGDPREGHPTATPAGLPVLRVRERRPRFADSASMR